MYLILTSYPVDLLIVDLIMAKVIGHQQQHPKQNALFEVLKEVILSEKSDQTPLIQDSTQMTIF
ncbi:MAG: hypothetical protein AAF985_17445 [Bacteroidota bacterium]